MDGENAPVILCRWNVINAEHVLQVAYANLHNQGNSPEKSKILRKMRTWLSSPYVFRHLPVLPHPLQNIRMCMACETKYWLYNAG